MIPTDGNTRGTGDFFYESPTQDVHGQMVMEKKETQRNGQTKLVICVFE